MERCRYQQGQRSWKCKFRPRICTSRYLKDLVWPSSATGLSKSRKFRRVHKRPPLTSGCTPKQNPKIQKNTTSYAHRSIKVTRTPSPYQPMPNESKKKAPKFTQSPIRNSTVVPSYVSAVAPASLLMWTFPSLSRRCNFEAGFREGGQRRKKKNKENHTELRQNHKRSFRQKTTHKYTANDIVLMRCVCDAQASF